MIRRVTLSIPYGGNSGHLTCCIYNRKSYKPFLFFCNANFTLLWQYDGQSFLINKINIVMKENKKDNTDQSIIRPTRRDDPDKRYPNPDDPNEEKGMPNKEMPVRSNPHHEELLDYIPK
jgi:hypothetical protein